MSTTADPCAAPKPAVDPVLAAIQGWRAEVLGPLVLAIDGPGASGKSTIAAEVAAATGAALVHTDDFFRWPSRPPAEDASAVFALENYYDWPRIRAEALEPLRAQATATFRRFDWETGAGLGGFVTILPSQLVVLEGVFSSSPQLGDLVDRSILVHTSPAERLKRLRARISPEEWDEDWLAAERAYFGTRRPPGSFSLVVPGTNLPAEQLKGTA